MSNQKGIAFDAEGEHRWFSMVKQHANAARKVQRADKRSTQHQGALHTTIAVVGTRIEHP